MEDVFDGSLQPSPPALPTGVAIRLPPPPPSFSWPAQTLQPRRAVLGSLPHSSIPDYSLALYITAALCALCIGLLATCCLMWFRRRVPLPCIERILGRRATLLPQLHTSRKAGSSLHLRGPSRRGTAAEGPPSSFSLQVASWRRKPIADHLRLLGIPSEAAARYAVALSRDGYETFASLQLSQLTSLELEARACNLVGHRAHSLCCRRPQRRRAPGWAGG